VRGKGNGTSNITLTSTENIELKRWCTRFHHFAEEGGKGGEKGEKGREKGTGQSFVPSPGRTEGGRKEKAKEILLPQVRNIEGKKKKGVSLKIALLTSKVKKGENPMFTIFRLLGERGERRETD